MDLIGTLHPFPSYQSCIKFYGRPILPPLLLQPDQNEISKIREQVAAVEAKLNQLKKQKHSSLLERSENSENINESSDGSRFESGLLVSGDTLPFDISTDCALDKIHEEEEAASVKSSSNLGVDEKIPAKEMELQNPLLRSLEMFQRNSPVFGNINLFVSSGSTSFGDSCGVSYTLLPENERGRISPVASESSGDQGLSDNGCQPSERVLAASYEELSYRDSADQSTDIEKYVDFSTDDSQLTDGSTVIGDKEVVDCMNGINSCDIEDSKTIFSDTTASTPTMLQPLDLSMNSDCRQNPFNTECAQVASCETLRDISSCKTPPTMSESKNVSNMRQTMRLNVTPENPVVNSESKTKAGSRHKRSSSYTIDIPSPVLLKSHANCPCLASSKCNIVPHCSSIELKNSSIPSDEGNCCFAVNKNDQNVAKKIEEKLQREDNSLDKGTAESCDPSEGPVDETLVATLAEAFKKLQQEKIAKLEKLQEQQWEELRAELRVHELELRKHIESLGIKIPASEEKARGEFSLEHRNQPTIPESISEPRDQLKNQELSPQPMKQFEYPELSPKPKSQLKNLELSPKPRKQLEFPELSPKPRKQLAYLECSPEPKNQLKSVRPSPKPRNQLKNLEFSPEPKNQPLNQAGPKQAKCCKPAQAIQKPIRSTSWSDVSRTSMQKSYLEADSCSRISKTSSEKKMPSSRDNDHLLSVLKAVSDPAMQKRFEKMSAVAKGYLTRRLLKTVDIQKLLKVIEDTAVEIQNQQSCDRIEMDEEECELQIKLARQLTVAFDELHRIFFEATIKERMQIIARSREYEKRANRRAIAAQVIEKLESYKNPLPNHNRLSSATVKRLERKQMKNEHGWKARKCFSASSFNHRPAEEASTHNRLHASQSFIDSYGHKKRNAVGRKCTVPGHVSFQ